MDFVLEYISKVKIPIKRGTFVELRTGLINVSCIGRNCSQAERNAYEKFDLEVSNMLFFFFFLEKANPLNFCSPNVSITFDETLFKLFRPSLRITSSGFQLEARSRLMCFRRDGIRRIVCSMLRRRDSRKSISLGTRLRRAKMTTRFTTTLARLDTTWIRHRTRCESSARLGACKIRATPCYYWQKFQTTSEPVFSFLIPDHTTP
jgi:hypothetical protein